VPKEVAELLPKIRGFEDNAFFLPRIALREILFRRLYTLNQLIASLAKTASTIEKLTGCEKQVLHSPLRFRWHLYRRVISWCEENSITLVRIPINAIRWSGLIQASVNRLPPFSPFSPEGSSEKGFRDALVVETIAQYVKLRPTKRIVFISNDNLILDTVKKRKETKSVILHKSLDEYLSYLKLQSKHFVDSFIATVLQALAEAFYSPNVPDCLYLSANVVEKILLNHAVELNRPPPPTAYSPFPYTSNAFSVTANGVQLGETNIAKVIDNTTFDVSSGVKLGQSWSLGIFSIGEKFRIAEFKVFWRATFHVSGEEVKVIKAEFQSIQFTCTTFTDTTDPLLASYNLPPVAQRPLPQIPPSSTPSQTTVPVGDLFG